ncbi:MAG: esterase-like activity of phytase family protein [Hansschlegelia sp.]
MIRRLACLVALTLVFGQSAEAAEAEAIEVSSSPIDRFDAGTPIGAPYGKLVFLGGLQLRSSDPDFGGLSGLRLSADGADLTAISDRGNWFRGRLTYDGSRPVALTGVTRAPTPGRDGQPLPGGRGFDTESLEIEGRVAWIAAERVNWLTRYQLGPDGRPSGRGAAVALPGIAKNAPVGTGYEAIAALKDGRIALVAEQFLDEQGDNRAFVAGGGKAFAFAVHRTDDFSPTDMTRLPDGDFVLLERRWRPPFSLSVRIRRLAAADIRPGARIDGPTLMEASLSQQIDNFEGVSAYRAADGRTVLTLVSDDNFSALQRTLLMQFALGAER